MDRLLSLRKSLANSSLNNTSISSELGYETAQDDSFSSLYYSINDDTLTNIDDSAGGADCSDAHSDANTTLSSQTNSEALRSTQMVTDEQPVESNVHSPQPVVDVVSDPTDPTPDVLPMEQESVGVEPDTFGLGALTAAENALLNLPSESALSTNNIANFAGRPTVVQELYVVAVAQQQTNAAPAINRGTKLSFFWGNRVPIL